MLCGHIYVYIYIYIFCNIPDCASNLAGLSRMKLFHAHFSEFRGKV